MIQLLLYPILQLYIQYKIMRLAMQVLFLSTMFKVYTDALHFVMNYFLSRLGSLDFPCMFAFVLNELQIMAMIQYGLSIWISIATGRFTIRLLMGLKP